MQNFILNSIFMTSFFLHDYYIHCYVYLAPYFHNHIERTRNPFSHQIVIAQIL